MRVKLTERSVAAAVVPKGKRDIVLWDTDLAVFACRITEAGGRHYQVFKRANGRRVRYPLGSRAVLRAEQARKLARQVIAAVDRGDDPTAERRALRAAPTLNELADRYLSD